MAAPQNKGRELDQFNDALRAHPEYRDFLRSIGANPDGALKLNGRQRSQAEAWIRQRVPDLPDKFQVDGAANVNTDHGISTAWSNPYFRTALIAGGTLATLGPALIGFGGAGSSGAASGAAGAGAAGATGAGATAAGVGKALSTAQIARDVISSLGAGAGDAADAMAAGRSSRIDARLTTEQVNQRRRADDRESRNDAHKAYLQSQYLADPNRGKGPGVAGQYSKPLNLPPLDPAIVEARRAEAAKRLQTPYEDVSIDDDLRASGAEKALGIGSTVAGIAGAIPDSAWKKLGRLIV